MLIIVLGLSTVMGMTLFNITSSQQRASQTMVQKYEQLITRNGVESITNVAISKALRSESLSGSFTIDNVTCNVSRTNTTQDSVTEASKQAMTIVCDYDGVKDSTTVVMMRPAYSYFGYFSSSSTWPAHIVFESGDTLAAPVYGNAPIHIDGHPVFLDKVVSTADSFEVINSGKARTYGGTEFNADVIDLPNNSTLADLENEIAANGRTFSDANDLYITFKSDSTFDWVQGAASGNESIAGANGLIMLSSGFDLHVKGMVAGKVTVLAADDIYIDSTLVYNDDPNSIDGSDDYLGLIAKDDITIKRDYSNLNIHAAMIALQDLEVENHDSGLPMGTLTILGSIAVYRDNPFGTYIGGLLTTGYKRNLVYDARLKDRTPPYFPRLLDRIEIAYRTD